MDSFSSEDPRDTETSTTASTSDVGFLPLAVGPNTSVEEGAQEDPPPLGLLPEVFHLAEGSFVEQPGWRNLGVESLDLPRGSPFHNHVIPGGQEGHHEAETEDGVDGPGVPLERPLQDVLDLLRSTDSAPPQLRELEYQVLSFRDRLKVCLLFAGRKPCFADGVTTGSVRSWGREPGPASWPHPCVTQVGDVSPLGLHLFISPMGVTAALNELGGGL